MAPSNFVVCKGKRKGESTTFAKIFPCLLNFQVYDCLITLLLTGLPTSDDEAGTQQASQIAMEGHLLGKGYGESVDKSQSTTTSKDGELPSNLPDCVVKCKSVFKCRLCPRIVCLTQETLQAHLISKVSFFFFNFNSNKILSFFFLFSFLVSSYSHILSVSNIV